MPFNVQCKKCLHYRNEWCKQKLDSPDPDLVRDCLYYSTATNADRIRAMTDEELAEMHVGVGCPPGTDLNELCVGDNGEELLCTPPRCRECWLNWLRQEADT